MKKKVFLLLIVMLTMAPQVAIAYDFSAVAPSGQTLYYNIVNGEARVTQSPNNNKPTGELTIPNSVTYSGTTYSVTSISAHAFNNCSGLTSVIIPNSVTLIDTFAFYYCYNLISVSIPNSVISIGPGAFAECYDLAYITIPNSVTWIGEESFFYCFGLTSITIPDSVTLIGNLTFYGCSGLTSVTIGNGVTLIDDCAFQGCSGLTSVTIPNSVSSIGNRAFQGCTSLTSITIGNGVTLIDDYAFQGCSGLTSVIFNADSCISAGSSSYPIFSNCDSLSSITIGNDVQRIPNFLCSSCCGLTSVTIPSNVTSIGNCAFQDCSGLTSVTIPNSVTSIGHNTFYNCNGLTSVNYTGTIAQWCNITFYNYYSNPIYYSHSLNINSFPITNLIIPNNVTSICDYAFENCNGLTSVTISNSVTSIGDYAFANCHSLDTVYMMPLEAPSIGTGAFFSYDTGRVFILYECSYDNYYNNPSWFTYRHSLRDPIIDINLILLVNDSTYGAANAIPGLNNHDIRCDSSAVIMATPNYGYHFEHWSNGRSANPDTIILSGDSTITVFFMPNQYTLTVTAGEHGTATGGGTFYYGDTTTIQATPESHYHFIQWSDGNTENPRHYRVETDITLTAFFVIDTYTVNVVSSDIIRGMVEANGTQFVYGTPCTVIATAYTGYTFAGWSNGVTVTPYTFAVISDVELIALFVEEGEEVYTVTVQSANPTMGSVSGGGQALYGGTLTIRAIPNDGYRFLHWNDGNTENPRTVTVTENATYTAYFESTTQGIHEAINNTITVYPNPTSGIVRIASDDVTRIDVYSVNGKLVKSVFNASEVDISPFPSGVYTLRVTTILSSFIHRVIKQ